MAEHWLEPDASCVTDVFSCERAPISGRSWRHRHRTDVGRVRTSVAAAHTG